MKIKWYGHSAFLITSDEGTKIIIDPYEPGAFGGQLSYGKIKDQADIVLTSHDHADHNYTQDLPGTPQVVKGSGSKTLKGISMKGVSTYHDPSQGSERGANTIFTIKINNIQLCHLGDLGHLLSDKELAEIGPVDILLIPCRWFFYHRPKRSDPCRRTDKAENSHPYAFQDRKMWFFDRTRGRLLERQSKHQATQGE